MLNYVCLSENVFNCFCFIFHFLLQLSFFWACALFHITVFLLFFVVSFSFFFVFWLLLPFFLSVVCVCVLSNFLCIFFFLFFSCGIPLQNKVTEKFKRPFKKRHSSVYHQPTNRVNKYLSQAIEARSVDRDKSIHVKRITLQFRDKDKERQYRQDLDLGFTTAMGCSILLLILSAALQVSFKSRKMDVFFIHTK